MWKALFNCWKVPELRNRLLFTMAILALCRVAASVPCPGVNPAALSALFDKMSDQAAAGQLATMLNMFTGGAMQKFAVASLGIMPYITASIIMSLLGPMIPALEKWKREGETGYQKLTQWTRYLTLIICCVQGWMFSVGMENPAALFGSAAQGIDVVTYAGNNPILFRIQTVIILTSGTMILMWLGEKITERGIGQGASLIITIGIINRLPSALYTMYGRTREVGDQQLSVIHIFILVALFVLVTAAVIALSVGQRRVPIQYARARAGRAGGMGGGAGQGSFFPLRVNFAGVMPIIFGSTLLTVPPFLFRFLSRRDIGWLAWLHGIREVDGEQVAEGINFLAWVPWAAQQFEYGSGSYMFLYAALVLFFCFFWVANQFNPIKIADDLKRSSAYIPGYRPGKETADYLDWTMTRVTAAGAVFLTTIALLPMIFNKTLNVPMIVAYFFGGTSLLIMVGVMLDTLRQIEALMLTHGGYDSFMKTGRIRGRRR